MVGWHMPQVLTRRFQQSPRNDVYIKLHEGIMKLSKVQAMLLGHIVAGVMQSHRRPGCSC